MEPSELTGSLRRIRRIADLSQRELATACGVATSVIAHAESGRRGMTVAVLGAAAGVAGLRLALVDAAGSEVRPMADGAVRDMADRRFPAHLDTRYGDEDWWHGIERYCRTQPWYTFDLDRQRRTGRRVALGGTPDDHLLPQAGDSPDARRAARRAAARMRAKVSIALRRLADPPPPDHPWVCDCPPECAELEEWQGPPRHARECLCHCDPC